MLDQMQIWQVKPAEQIVTTLTSNVHNQVFKQLNMYKKIFVILSLLFIPISSAAAIGNLNNAAGNLTPAARTAGYQEGNIGNITGQIINTALSLVGIIFLALMVYAGYLWMTARGEESQIETAKKIVTSAIIGLVITMSAYAITTLVTTKFSGSGSGASGDNPADVAACNAQAGKVW